MEMRKTNHEKVYTVDEVASIFRVTRRTIRQLIHSGTLPAMRLGRIYRIPQSAIDRYFNLPARTHLTPEDLGFGVFAQDTVDEDSVEYVNRFREAEDQSLQEMVETLSKWQQ
jgi:excisionase family DNA binding protein